jgi:uncharacterized protein YutE (UPF0331/DUF86 family)
MATYGERQERAVLERLRDRYEREGYSFYLYPPSDFLPSFLEGYRPDALALKEGSGVVIEVKSRASSPKDLRLSELARRFSGRDNWRLEIVNTEAYPDEPSIEPPSRAQIESELHGVEILTRQGQFRAAFVIAWSVLEAVVRALRREAQENVTRPLEANQISEMLARNGFIDQNSAQALRRLGRMRNAIVHGSLEQDVTQTEVASLMAITRGVLGQLEPAV